MFLERIFSEVSPQESEKDVHLFYRDTDTMPYIPFVLNFWNT